MGNSTFGVDPDRGHVKSLRIYTRGPNGQNRTFEYAKAALLTARSSEAGLGRVGTKRMDQRLGRSLSLIG